MDQKGALANSVGSILPLKGDYQTWRCNLSRVARLRDIDAFLKTKLFGEAVFHFEGSLIEFKTGRTWDPYEGHGHSSRSCISGFSAASRRRLLRLCASIRQTALPVFLTLTYPSQWPSDPKVWKRHLDTFQKWLRRTYSGASGIWKLEPQQRGAPHFHLLVWGIEFIPHEAVARRWFEIVGSNDSRHLQAGTRVEAIRSRNGVMLYASKLYMGKEVKGFERVGRFWGVINRRALPLSLTKEFEVPEVALVKIRRIFRRLMRSRGIRARNNRSFTLFSSGHLLWARVIDWAEGQ